VDFGGLLNCAILQSLKKMYGLIFTDYGKLTVSVVPWNPTFSTTKDQRRTTKDYLSTKNVNYTYSAK
jgi:hypothetical protein